LSTAFNDFDECDGEKANWAKAGDLEDVVSKAMEMLDGSLHQEREKH
jgi:hypothetical protein